MGVFGAGVFADDDALDVRSDYKIFLADAQSDALATDTIARQYDATLDDPGATTSFWLALAWTQWNIGRLDPRVKTCALRIIDENLDLKQWQGSPLYRERERVLRQARAKLDSPQPAAKPIPKPVPVQLPGWEFSEIVGVRMPNGKLALLHMIVYRTSSRYGARAPVVSILNWTSTEFPSAEDLAALTYINWRRIQCGNHLYCLASSKKSPLTPSLFIHSGLKKPVTRDEGSAAYGGLAKEESLYHLLTDVLEPYWENPALPPHHPGFDKPEAQLFKRKP